MWKERKWCQKPFLLGLTSGAHLHFLDTRPNGLNFLNLHIHDRLSFFSLPLCPVLTPSIEFFISFNQHGYQGVVRNPFGEVWMFPDVAVKLSDKLGILLFKYIHGKSPRRKRSW